MQPTSANLSAAIQVPTVDIDEPVAVIAVASVAPLEGPPDGERTTTFAVAPQHDEMAAGNVDERLRQRVMRKPLTAVAAAFAVGVLVARLL